MARRSHVCPSEDRSRLSAGGHRVETRRYQGRLRLLGLRFPSRSPPTSAAGCFPHSPGLAGAPRPVDFRHGRTPCLRGCRGRRASCDPGCMGPPRRRQLCGSPLHALQRLLQSPGRDAVPIGGLRDHPLDHQTARPLFHQPGRPGVGEVRKRAARKDLPADGGGSCRPPPGEAVQRISPRLGHHHSQRSAAKRATSSSTTS